MQKKLINPSPNPNLNHRLISRASIFTFKLWYKGEMFGGKCPDRRRSQHASTSRRVNGIERRSSAAALRLQSKNSSTSLNLTSRPQQRGVNDACSPASAEVGVRSRNSNETPAR